MQYISNFLVLSRTTEATRVFRKWPMPLGWALAAAVASSFSAWGVERNDYIQKASIPAEGWVNGLDIDPATGHVLVSWNHSISVWPKGPGLSPQPLTRFPVNSNLSPSGAVISGGDYLVSYYWGCGIVDRFNDQGTKQGTAFELNADNCGSRGIYGMVADSHGRLVMASVKLPSTGQWGTIVTDQAGNTQWEVPGTASQTAVDMQDNVYVAGQGNKVKVYDKSTGALLREVGPLANANNFVGGVAVDIRGNVYLSHDNPCDPCTVQKFGPTGNFLTTITGFGAAGGNGGNATLGVDPSGQYVYVLSDDTSGQKRIAVFEQTFESPPAPTLSAMGSNPPATIQATWSAPATPMTSYSLEISLDKNTWAAITVSGTETDRGITASDFPGLTSGTYYLRIKATDPDGTSPYSQVVEAKVPAGPHPKPGTPTPVPALGHWALAAMAILLSALGWRRLHR